MVRGAVDFEVGLGVVSEMHRRRRELRNSGDSRAALSSNCL